MESKLQFRLSKSGQTLSKSKKYQIKLNGNSLGEIDFQNHSLLQSFPTGKYSIEVGENDYFIRKEIVLNAGQMLTITINPSLTFPFVRSFLIGIAIVSIFFQFIMLDKVSIPLMLIPLIPILVFRKHNYSESFALTVSKT